MQQEILEILQTAAAEPVSGKAPEPIQLVPAHTRGQSTWHREDIYGDQGR
jgi:hypothetical protein